MKPSTPVWNITYSNAGRVVHISEEIVEAKTFRHNQYVTFIFWPRCEMFQNDSVSSSRARKRRRKGVQRLSPMMASIRATAIRKKADVVSIVAAPRICFRCSILLSVTDCRHPPNKGGGRSREVR